MMKHEPLEIVEATACDRERIRSLWSRVIEDVYERKDLTIVPPHQETDFKMRQFDEDMKNGRATYYLAFEGERMIGTIAYGSPPNKGILKRTGYALEHEVEIGSLYIDPNSQKKGYGYALLIHVLKTLEKRGVKTVVFDTIIESSRNLWLKLFGDPAYTVPSKTHDFKVMIWVVTVRHALESIHAYRGRM